MTSHLEQLRALFDNHEQQHVFAHWDAITNSEREELLGDCARVDFEWLDNRLTQFRSDTTEIETEQELIPAPVIALPQTDKERQTEAQARMIGEEVLRAGRLAAFLVAGGQGTRLGFDGPKGCYPVGPVTGKTLFQWHAEQIRARAKRYGATIPWYIMTSRTNHEDTVHYFEENDYLGFDRNDVMFFQQRMVPSIDFNGKLILSDKNRLALNPDGHGGSLHALVASGAIADMKRRGIDTISYFQVDNPLVTICDPVFAGYHLQVNAQMSSKILNKSCPEEKVGHVCYHKDKLTVIEYSDLNEKNMYAKDEKGKLVFWAGSIAIHMLAVDFVERVGGQAELPWHVAQKKIPAYDGTTSVTPDSPNGIKFETFVFDALPLTTDSVTMEVAREEEFAPVKNKNGVDSAESCRQLLSNRFARWLAACNTPVAMEANGNARSLIEISPLYALDAEELRPKLTENLTVKNEIVLE